MAKVDQPTLVEQALVTHFIKVVTDGSNYIKNEYSKPYTLAPSEIKKMVDRGENHIDELTDILAVLKAMQRM